MVSWLFIVWVLSILFTPGPTNTLLASSGVQVGVRASFVLIPAEAFGYLIAISAWGFVMAKIALHIPLLPAILKLFSAAYMLYLASKLWRSAHLAHDLSSNRIYPYELFFATLLNPKALLFASAVFPNIAWLKLEYYVAHVLVFLVILIPVAVLWTLFGSLLVNNRFSWLNQCNMQKTASVVLVGFSIPLSYSVFANL